jgi:hypothetical protein
MQKRQNPKMRFTFLIPKNTIFLLLCIALINSKHNLQKAEPNAPAT